MSHRKVDVVVIGAGVAGACAARELARYDLRTVVLEAGFDIAGGASRANSGIVHAGFDPMPGTLKAHYNVEGSRIFAQWASELGFGYWQNGAMVVAFDEGERAKLDELMARGAQNGVEGLSIISGEEARELEPSLSADVVAALLAPTSAICDPYGLVYGAMENAVDNGVEIVFDRMVFKIEAIDPSAQAGGPDETAFLITARNAAGETECIEARAIVNAAGVYADEISAQVSGEIFVITPRRGEYCLYENRYGHTFMRTMFQAPTEAGKGVLVTPTIHGNLLVGPSAVRQHDKLDASTTYDGLGAVIESARRTWPAASREGVISTFAGIRATWPDGDFVIGETEDVPCFFNIGGFDSPGLTAAPAVAIDVARDVAARLGAAENAAFNPKRVPAPLLAMMDPEARGRVIEQDARYANVVCRCCDVSEGELVEAMHRGIPALTLDALKWRTGATMGPCHGGACEARIVELMSRELGVRPDEILKRHAGSNLVFEAGEGNSAAGADATESDVASAGFVDAAGAEGVSAAAGAEPNIADEYDLVVVGGGVAGMAAALNARNAGVERVLIIERDPDLGGTVGRLTNPSFGIVRFGEMIPGVEFVRREREAFNANPADILTGAQVLRITPGAGAADAADAAAAAGADAAGATHEVTFSTPKGVDSVRTRAVVLACGGREHSAGELALSGGRPAGVFTAGSASAYANQLDCKIGSRAMVYGIDSGAAMAAAGLLSRGIEVDGVYLNAPDASVLKPGVEGFLKSLGIPLHFGKRIVQLEGTARLIAVWFEDLATGEFAPLSCDTLVVSIDSAPETALAERTGAQFDPATGGLVVDAELGIGIPGIFACGNMRRIHDGADFATMDGEVAGRNAARYLLGESE